MEVKPYLDIIYLSLDESSEVLQVVHLDVAQLRHPRLSNLHLCHHNIR